MSDKASVQEALSAVMAALPNIGKNDKSPEGYVYRGIEAITKHVQPLLAQHGVIICPEATITDVRPSPAMKEGWTDVFMDVAWTITGPDGSTLLARTQGIGRDRADKGANKAQTQAFKYLLLHLFCIADGKDDSDGQTYEHDRHERPALPDGWASEEECKAAHDEIAATIKASSEQVQTHMREWRRDRKLPWPMPRTDLDVMWEEVASATTPTDDAQAKAERLRAKAAESAPADVKANAAKADA